jgi:glycogen operon protein
MATLCFSSGVPMLTAGDDRVRTPRPDNNTYRHDNEITSNNSRRDDAWLDVYEITKTALRLRRDHPALRQRHWFEGRPTIKGGIKDLVWVHPDGREMSTDDWNDDSCRTVGMFLNGAPLRSPGPRGEQIHDKSFMIWLNAGPDDVKLTLPDNKWVHHGEVVLSTNAEIAVGSPARAGSTLELQAHSVLVLRET